MTKKRFKLTLAALGVLAAFLMALMAFLLAPTFASLGKDTGPGHKHLAVSKRNAGASPNPIYFEHLTRHETENASWNAPGGPGEPCVGGARACADQNETADTHDFDGDGTASSSGTGGSPSGAPGGDARDGNGSGGGVPGGTFAGGYGFSGGGSGGSSGNGNMPPHDQSGAGDKSPGDPGPSDKGPGIRPLIFDNPGPDTPPPDFGPLPLDPPNPDGPPGGDPPPGLTETHKVPEPLTLSLFAVGLAGSAALRRRSKAK